MFATIEALVRPLPLTPDALKHKAVEWHGELRQFDPQTLVDAAREHCRASPHWPSLSDILTACRDVRHELGAKVPGKITGAAQERWHPPTDLERARVRLLAATIINGYGYEWYSRAMDWADRDILAEADKFEIGGKLKQ